MSTSNNIFAALNAGSSKKSKRKEKKARAAAAENVDDAGVAADSLLGGEEPLAAQTLEELADLDLNQNWGDLSDDDDMGGFISPTRTAAPTIINDKPEDEGLEHEDTDDSDYSDSESESESEDEDDTDAQAEADKGDLSDSNSTRPSERGEDAKKPPLKAQMSQKELKQKEMDDLDALLNEVAEENKRQAASAEAAVDAATGASDDASATNGVDDATAAEAAAFLAKEMGLSVQTGNGASGAASAKKKKKKKK
mmetsp:Transcript_10351/g.16957  ORF Transcript_10351/g.16957 Transcript_10351/m.16957 type:complete len:253 (+) Transcript_10351:891-1649(+)